MAGFLENFSWFSSTAAPTTCPSQDPDLVMTPRSTVDSPQYVEKKKGASWWWESKPLEAWEAALESWIEFRATGYSVDVKLVQEMLPTIAKNVPRLARGVSQLFQGDGCSSRPMFMLLLRPYNGKVYFLYFWKAFGEAMHMTGAAKEDCLTSELETLRDRMLRCSEERTNEFADQQSAPSDQSRLPTISTSTESRFLFMSDVKEEIECAASMSAYPNFWKRCSEALASRDGSNIVTIEDLTILLLAWLHDSTCWQLEVDRPGDDTEDTAPINNGFPVYLHIYDVSKEESVSQVNRILCPMWLPMKVGGIFHAGVEINGLEWCYGFSKNVRKPGVACVKPRCHPQHHYRQTVELGFSQANADQIGQLISLLIEEYPGNDYNILRRNCCHFADDFCKRLGVGGIPSWVHRLARLGAGIESIVYG